MTETARQTHPTDGALANSATLPTQTRLIPLNKLTLHPDNVRRTDRAADIAQLAASIESHGLLQNLAVVAMEDDRFGVIAGGRRLAALKRLAKEGRIARDFPTPCLELDRSQAREASLAENTQRTAMNVMDEVEAFALLVDGGVAVDDIARRFGSTVRHVEQRLALARLSPKIRAAYRKGDLTLDVARAFCLAADHATQERIFRQSAKPITQAYAVRHALTQGRVSLDDRIARFVGLKAYEAAGGRVVRDLFEDAVGFLDDGALVQRLAQDRLASAREAFVSEGWGWVEVRSGHGVMDGCVGERLQASMRAPTAGEKRQIASARADLARLETAAETTPDDSPLWGERDAAEARLEALEDALKVWDPTLIAHAGVALSVDHDGRLVATRGLIKRTAIKALDTLRNVSRESAPDEIDDDDGDGQTADKTASCNADHLPKAQVTALTSVRTCALRAELLARPHVALALLVHALDAQMARTPLPGMGISARFVSFSDDDLPVSVADPISLPARIARSTEALLEQLAMYIAATLDVSHEGATHGDRRVHAVGDEIAAAVDLDMRPYWTPDAAFWMRAPKSLALSALASAPPIAALPADQQRARMAHYAKLKKAELAAIAVEALEGAGWLPDILVTPIPAGALALTDAGHAAIGDREAD